jgi:hypothetical protein
MCLLSLSYGSLTTDALALTDIQILNLNLHTLVIYVRTDLLYHDVVTTVVSSSNAGQCLQCKQNPLVMQNASPVQMHRYKCGSLSKCMSRGRGSRRTWRKYDTLSAADDHPLPFNHLSLTEISSVPYWILSHCYFNSHISILIVLKYCMKVERTISRPNIKYDCGRNQIANDASYYFVQ